MVINMEDNNLIIIKRRLRNILMNMPIQEETHCDSPEYEEVNGLLNKLELDLEQVDRYLLELCKGNFNAPLPPLHNRLANRLRDFKSILEQLTWQANQVARGNYRQKFEDFGGISSALTSIAQELLAKSEKTSCNPQALSALMDDSSDKLIAVDASSGDVVYANSSAKSGFFNPDTGDTVCGGHCPLLEKLKGSSLGDFEYYCAEAGFYMSVTSYAFSVSGRELTVCRIRDLGPDHAESSQISNIIYTDFLTGLYNRRYCFELLDNLIKNNSSFSLVVTDLNDLNIINKNYSHQVGDEYINRFVACMKDRSRDGDTVCRAGSDEFVLILPSCSHIAAERKMESIQDEMNSSVYPISISYGILTLPITPGPNPKEAFQMAIDRMYEMKRIRRMK